MIMSDFGTSTTHPKTELEIGVELFNTKWKQGMKFLIEQGLIKDDAQSIAQFLAINKQTLNFEQVGEYLGEPSQKEVLKAYIGMMNFKGLSFTAALRKVMTDFKFPGEAQKIDRIMETFGNHYFQSNQGEPDFEFKDPDAAYTLAFSCVMLNTDAHNPSIKKKNKMTLQEFIKNNRGINQGTNFSDKLLESIYKEIQANEIKLNQKPESKAEKPEPDHQYEQWAAGKGRYKIGYLSRYYTHKLLGTESTPNTLKAEIDTKDLDQSQTKSDAFTDWSQGKTGLKGYRPGYLCRYYLSKETPKVEAPNPEVVEDGFTFVKLD